MRRIIALVLLLALPVAARAQDEGIPVGTPAPVVSINDLDGKPVDLGTWIGEDEENRAWDLLGRARESLAASGATPEAAPAAFESLYAAEGSDWFWWLGEDQDSSEDDRFDDLFRAHLRGVYRALGAEPPAFGHHNLLVGPEGQALSKRDRSISIQGMREEGLEPLAVASYSATIGTSDTIAPHQSLHELVVRFAFGKLSRAPARFDVAELRALNARLLHALPYEAVAPRLRAMGVGGGEAFWRAVRSNLAVLSDAEAWWDVVNGPIEPVIADVTLCQEAAALLPPEPWDESTWERWAADIKQATGIKGKALFQPLRLALTGREHGPELKLLLPLIGQGRALARLEGRTA